MKRFSMEIPLENIMQDLNQWMDDYGLKPKLGEKVELDPFTFKLSRIIRENEKAKKQFQEIKLKYKTNEIENEYTNMYQFLKSLMYNNYLSLSVGKITADAQKRYNEHLKTSDNSKYFNKS